ncbi:dipeptidase [Companilactobacillus sp. RD055328]|uniref:C69 family dipeptidase n=1 Tax=Companilactobacillus sp. RD055328 TaxID=2916634 RepID=UPI001FC8D2D7|nr:C69 family dipeptidase [Companilactobacillus sp. RD055328]GKQ42408.1 dipeptidase [Companilactobacillus sp. RD055328]
MSKLACTTLLVGKNASMDNSTLVGRNEDAGGAINPKKFMVITPDKQPRHYQAKETKFAIDLLDEPLRYTSTPDANDEYGIYAESGINSANVAMSASETITTNSRILGIDPFVPNGIGEEDIVTIVLPYITSAKAGVLRMGELLTKYGTYESNGIIFSDKNDIWYMETLGGHHWAAVKIPDDAYVIAPNRLNIDDFDFDSDEYLCSSDLKEFIDTNNLNPDIDGYNLRHIFGSSTIKDTRYNNPRAWYVQKLFNPEMDNDPRDYELPFICRANKKISIEDIKFALSSHFENTDYDVYGNGTDADKKSFRPIGINRNQETHILQIRNDVSDEIAGIHWLAYGPNTFNALVPFYSNVNEVPTSYQNTKSNLTLDNTYWLNRIISLLGDYDYELYSNLEDTFDQKVMSECKNLQLNSDQKAIKSDNIQNYLATINEQYAQINWKHTIELLDSMVKSGSEKMKLRFSLGD